MGHGGKRTGAGRPKKAEVPQFADKGIASRVLGSIDEEQRWHECLRSDLTHELRVALPLGEKRLIEETLEYLTDRREGKPAQGVFVGDTRETMLPLDRGDLPHLIETPQSGGTGKPN